MNLYKNKKPIKKTTITKDKKTNEKTKTFLKILFIIIIILSMVSTVCFTNYIDLKRLREQTNLEIKHLKDNIKSREERLKDNINSQRDEFKQEKKD